LSDMAKNLILWLVIAVVLMSVFQSFGPGSNDGKTVDYTTFVHEVGQGQIQEATFKGEQISFTRNGVSGKYTTYMPVYDNKILDDLINQNVKVKGTPPEEQSLLSTIFISWFPMILLIGVWIFFMRQMQGGGGKGAMSFGKSKARMMSEEQIKTTFADVAGCDEAKEDVKELVDYLRDPSRFQKLGGKIPTGVLMVGPPGTGKTLLAKAIAGEAKVPFFTISGSDFVEMFVGVGASRVRDMFEQAKKAAPCIIFIDEIDAVGRQRGAGLGGGNDEREQTLNSLLVEMDGFDTTEGVIIMAATNRPDVLDKALLRPGRFDREVVIGLPDLKGREEILKVHAKRIKLSEDVNLEDIARSSPGFAGADLANLLNEGALMAARKNKKQVEMIDIYEAKDKISFGRERRQLMDEEDKRMTAFHEAGHALIAALLYKKKIKLHKVTIIPRGRALGLTMSTATKDILGQSKKELIDDICMAMGGRIGEEVETGDFSNGAAMDIKQATNIARHMVCDWGMSSLGPIAFGDNEEHLFLGREISKTHNLSEETAKRIDEEVSKIITTQFDRAKKLIEENREALTKIAEALLEFETIEGKHVQEIVEYGEIRSEVISTKTEEKKRKQEESEKEDSEEKKASDKNEDIPPAVDGAQAMA